ncbi:MAG: lipid kinase [Novosphingobium sp. 28-62-57]|uniref:putative urea ABC transporter substrate-binding protein n=1 Tax=unclassified Novosphingobium TaxID=2644732 RepID=UPI000BDA33B1|nr:MULTISPECIES: putative urea ABC transporter substrate-binding protein [unclassified Novosphingobium]OYW49436.1 MAG: lipid kinase [Novosphingobium sp. 12-62-10]OYZ09193.1 MAG: lipid kinase [Novosphingobium sp. 28-62-57]OZA32987.1 MAG: lipid kinase [Novosphingobium sp. 17-62-9]HQS68353.1 putative urea ABC transporter substrate-binding protein [Novosphingobium sp.]
MFRLIGKSGKALLIAATLLAASCSPSADAPAPKRSEFSIGWSIYAGWMPWPYAQQAGIVKKWADKYGLKINIVQVNDYVESVNQYTAGKFDGVTVANMDALTIPAAGGKDTSAIIVGDYSNGNDGVLLKGGNTVAALKGQSIYLVELSVSHYLLARALNSNGMSLTDVKTINTGDADIVGAFSSPDAKAAVAWNPQLSVMRGQAGANQVFSSADIPGEILDLLVVDTATLKANPDLGKALAGIWYETVSLMMRDDAQGKEARAAMAKLAGTTPDVFDAQLKTTRLYIDAKEAVAATTSPELISTMTKVRDFSFSKGLFQGATSADAVGMGFPGGVTLGDPARVTLRFDESFMKLAADNKL